MDLWVTEPRGVFLERSVRARRTDNFHWLRLQYVSIPSLPLIFSSHVLFRPSAARETRQVRRSNGEKAKGQYRLGQKFFERVVIDTELISN